MDGFLAEAGSRHFMSALSVVELHSVFARLVRIGQITTAEFFLARGRFLADVAAGLWQTLAMSDSAFHRAQHLLVQHGLGHNLRTLDALQLATALLHTASDPLDGFVCADANLCNVATTEGLIVINPEVP